jgi:hypothetical protein
MFPDLDILRLMGRIGVGLTLPRQGAQKRHRCSQMAVPSIDNVQHTRTTEAAWVLK